MYGLVMEGGQPKMRRAFTMEYWPDDGGFVGRLSEVPEVFSQGDSLEELEENILDAYELVTDHSYSISSINSS